MKENQNEVKEEVVVENPNIKVVTLTSPIKKDDGTFLNEIKLDYGKLTGADMMQIDEEMKVEGHAAGFDSIYNQQVCLRLASKASGILIDDLLRLGVSDFAEVTFSARNFFFRS
ncbi:phage tail assembly protein [Lysinibacillus irui]|uniref:Phage tail assembly protein n=1 Tax=Lysinibacillus irui TaxID=2998077 RepID=A0ABU5NT12_9BACI|nr:phage tail assembly protein [Lysinibacillus irui]MEA0556455.1 phage tail assembly protein [Lysinibacillus irui]MEA0979182.1 phage tail assembly protein [Lysinibacillus irui]MEA1045336.1 phage tail assembly protein [Lysinibacillus irui]